MLSTTLRGIILTQQLPLWLQCSEPGKMFCDWGACLEHLQYLLSWLAAPSFGPLLEMHGGRYSLLKLWGLVSFAQAGFCWSRKSCT